MGTKPKALAYDEFAATGDGYQNMIDTSAAERTGTSDEIAEAGAFLLGEASWLHHRNRSSDRWRRYRFHQNGTI